MVSAVVKLGRLRTRHCAMPGDVGVRSVGDVLERESDESTSLLVCDGSVPPDARERHC